MPQAIFQIAELAEAESSLTVTQTPFVIPGPQTLPLLHGRWNRQRVAASQSLIGDACQPVDVRRSEEHTSELQSRLHLVCRLLLEKKKKHARIARNMRRDC